VNTASVRRFGDIMPPQAIINLVLLRVQDIVVRDPTPTVGAQEWVATL